MFLRVLLCFDFLFLYRHLRKVHHRSILSFFFAFFLNLSVVLYLLLGFRHNASFWLLFWFLLLLLFLSVFLLLLLLFLFFLLLFSSFFALFIFRGNLIGGFRNYPM